VVDGPPDAPGPWAASLAGRWRVAADAWQAAGERYEHAVELAASPDERARAEGLARLVSLGAHATADRLRTRLERPIGRVPGRSWDRAGRGPPP
jgi:hypothetical protein